MRKLYKISIVAGILAVILILSIISALPILATHQPEVPYIVVAGKLLPEDQASYKFIFDRNVPTSYKADARKAVASWKEALGAWSPDGSWTLCKLSNCSQDAVMGVADIMIRLAYDQKNSSFFCTNVATNIADALVMLKSLIIPSAYAEPMDSQRRTSMWTIYVGCGDELYGHQNIQRQVAHAIGHAFGMGYAGGGASSVMCHYDQRIPCEVSLVPAAFDVRCVETLYGTQGFVGPNVHERPEFCT